MEVSTLPRRGGGFLPHPRQVLRAYGDDRLVEQIRRGNDAAFEVVYERHHRGILSFCRHMLSSQEEAEDAVQQTFVSAYYDIRASDKEIRLKAWLYTIARNRCLTVLRARREQPAELDEIPTAGLSESVQQRDDLRRVLADMGGLPVEQRAALVMSELGDLSHAEIGTVLGCPTLKVKSLVFQARSSLIESREAREVSCREIREQLSTLRGGALRRGPLRKHLNVCPGCREFREEVRRQRAAIALILPVVPTAGLKSGVMAATGIGGGAGGAAVGVAGGGLAAACSGGAAKIAAVAIIAGGTVGAGAIVKEAVLDSGVEKAPASTSAQGAVTGGDKPPSSKSALLSTGAGGGAVLDRGSEKDSDKAKKSKKSKKGKKGKKGRDRGTRGNSPADGSPASPGDTAGITKNEPGSASPVDPDPAAPGPATPTPPANNGGGGGSTEEGPRHGGKHDEKDLPGGKHDGKGDRRADTGE